jgi:hypothetical protein
MMYSVRSLLSVLSALARSPQLRLLVAFHVAAYIMIKVRQLVTLYEIIKDTRNIDWVKSRFFSDTDRRIGSIVRSLMWNPSPFIGKCQNSIISTIQTDMAQTINLNYGKNVHMRDADMNGYAHVYLFKVVFGPLNDTYDIDVSANDSATVDAVKEMAGI